MASLLGVTGQTSLHSVSNLRHGQTSFLGNNAGLAASSTPCVQWRRRSHVATEAKVREIFMPALSSTMTEGKIVSWNKSEGDVLSKGESVVVVESDKADMDVETFYDGILAAIVVGDGEVAPVGAPIGILAESEEELDEAKAKAAKLGSSAPSSSSPAPAAEAAAPPPPPPPPPPPAAATPSQAVIDGKIVATPQAKKLAKQFKIDIAKVKGSGPFGRITPADVEIAAGKTPSPSATAPPPPPPPPAPVAAPAAAAAKAPPAPSAPLLPGTVVPFTSMQGAVSRNMEASLAVPTFRVGYSILTDKFEALAKSLKPKGVTVTVLLAKAVANALALHPVVNASCPDGSSFAYNSSVNVAVAVAIDGGLITPVLQDADKTDVYTLSAQWSELLKKARSKKLTPAEISTGTFTLSNLGMFGVDRFDAILPPGQGAIMAVGGSIPTMVATSDGKFGIKKQMQVNVTADHRIIYGADLAGFLQTLSKIIENPEDLTL